MYFHNLQDQLILLASSCCYCDSQVHCAVPFFQVILAGKKDSVSAAIKKAERFRAELLKRGVLLVPISFDGERKEPMKRKGFGLPEKTATSLPSIGVRLKGYLYFVMKLSNIT